MMNVGRNVQIHTVRCLVALHQFVPSHRIIERVELGKGLGGGYFARVVHGVASNVVFGQQLLFELLGEIVKCRPRVCKSSVGSYATRR